MNTEPNPATGEWTVERILTYLNGGGGAMQLEKDINAAIAAAYDKGFNAGYAQHGQDAAGGKRRGDEYFGRDPKGTP
jgi:hypothetical protein